MNKIYQVNNLSEDYIINNYLRKLNFNKINTFNFENDASYIFLKNKKVVITTDSISQDIDFFRGDSPKSIASKITTINLSDLSAMGVMPNAYLLNLFLPNYINHNWLSVFTNELLKIQKKYNFYLLGGDLSKSNKLILSSTFLGLSKTDNILPQNSISLNNDIWVTGNLGDSLIGLELLKKKISIKDIKMKEYFINKYYYPQPCMIGSKISKYASAVTDISDGFIGDLKKMLNSKYGAKLYIKNFPTSSNLKKIFQSKVIENKYILNSGDNYDLIVISSTKHRKKISNLAKKNNVKISLVGKIIQKPQIVDDSNNSLNIPQKFDHFR